MEDYSDFRFEKQMEKFKKQTKQTMKDLLKWEKRKHEGRKPTRKKESGEDKDRQ